MTTRFLKTDDGDLDLTSGNLVLIDDGSSALLPSGASQMAQAVKQKAEDVLRQFQGEWFLDQTKGFPWFQSVLGQKNPDLGVIRNLFKSKLLSIDNVSAVDDVVFDFDSTTRALDYKIVLLLTNGQQVTVSSG